MLPWAFVHQCLCSHVFTSLGYIHPGVELLGHIVTLWWIFRRPARHLSKVTVPLMFPLAVHEGSNFSHPQPQWLSIFFIIVAILLGMKWHLIVVWFAVPWWLSKPNFYQYPQNVSIFIGRAKYSQYRTPAKHGAHLIRMHTGYRAKARPWSCIALIVAIFKQV